MKEYRKDFPRAPCNGYNMSHLESWTLMIQTEGRFGTYEGDFTKKAPWESVNQREWSSKWIISLMEFVENIDVEKAPFIEFILSTIECKTTAALFKKRWM